jgi:hypothetical protein
MSQLRGARTPKAVPPTAFNETDRDSGLIAIRCVSRRQPPRHACVDEAGTREGAARRGDFVVPDDVKAVAVRALAHRLTLRPELWVQRVDAGDVVLECMSSVPVPTTGATN